MDFGYLLLNAIELADTSYSSNIPLINNILIQKKRRQAAVLANITKRRKIPKTKNFCETIDKMQEDVFYSHFRMTKATFKKLEKIIKPMWEKKSTGRSGISFRLAMYITLWKLCNNNSFREVSDRFGVAIGAAYKVFVKVIKLICSFKGEFIKFHKTSEEQTKVSDAFFKSRRNPFPFVIGCIDGTHIPISQPIKDGISFYNRKGTFSIIAQAVVDSEFKFLDVFVGCPGRCHDAAIWEMSPLKKAILNGDIKIAPNLHLLGDGAYPLEVFMMVPYRDNGFLTSQQSKFNTILSSSRVFVEQAFGILKKKFRILKYIEVQRPNLPKLITLACMILHNIIIIHEGREQNIENEYNTGEDFTENHNQETSELPSRQREEAKSKRDALATLLSG